MGEGKMSNFHAKQYITVTFTAMPKIREINNTKKTITKTVICANQLYNVIKLHNNKYNANDTYI